MSEYINEHYISTRINGGKDPGKEYKKKFNIRGYPTVLLLNPDGTEIDRIFGWDGKKQKYFQTLVDYTNGKNTIRDILSQLEKKPDDIDLNYRMAKKRAGRDELNLAKPYFETILNLV